MSPNIAVMNGLTVYNYNINIEELVAAFASYDHLFFFCPQSIRTIIQYAVKNSLEDLTNYNPLTHDVNSDLMSEVVKDIELYQSRNPHPFLDDCKYVDNLELIVSQIEECTDRHVRCSLPVNQQCEAVYPKWIGDDLIFALRVF